MGCFRDYRKQASVNRGRYLPDLGFWAWPIANNVQQRTIIHTLPTVVKLVIYMPCDRTPARINFMLKRQEHPTPALANFLTLQFPTGGRQRLTKIFICSIAIA